MGKTKKKPARLCSACGYRHPTPTGKNCIFASPEQLDDLHHSDASDELSSSDDDRASNSGSRVVDDIPPEKGSGNKELETRINARLDRLETLVLKSLDNKPKPPAKACNTDTDDSLFSEDTQDWEMPRRRRHKNKFDQKRFLPEGEVMNSFEMLMLATANNMLYLLEKKMDLAPLVHHFKFLASKSVRATYKPDAFVSYDNIVRQRVAKHGLAAFGEVSQEEVVLQFCPENMVHRGKPGKKSDQSAQSKKKGSNGYCKHFNDDDCTYKACVYAHRCMACDDGSHGRKACPSLKKSR